jgi:hypothetical protein
MSETRDLRIDNRQNFLSIHAHEHTKVAALPVVSSRQAGYSHLPSLLLKTRGAMLATSCLNRKDFFHEALHSTAVWFFTVTFSVAQVNQADVPR